MKTHNTRSFLAGFLAAIPVVGLATPAFAAMSAKTIEVFTGADIYVDGVEIKPTNANGKPVDVFIYNGTTYVPIRAVSQSLGYAVNWDGANQRVYIGDTPGQKQYLNTVCPPYQTNRYEEPSTFKMGGNIYNNGFILDNHGGYAIYNLNGKYQTLEFDLGYVEGGRVDCQVNIYLDGQIVKTIEMGAEDLPQHFSISLSGALQMKIENVRYGNTGEYGFANAILS